MCSDSARGIPAKPKGRKPCTPERAATWAVYTPDSCPQWARRNPTVLPVQSKVISLPIRCAVMMASALLWVGCDSAPGLDDSGEPPTLSDVTIFPRSVDLTALPSAALGGDVVYVPVIMEATASDPDGDLAGVAYVVQHPVPGEEPLARGSLEPEGSGRYTRKIGRAHV